MKILFLIILVIFSGCKLEKTIIVKKDVQDSYINEQLNNEEVRNNSFSTLKCECDVEINNIKFKEDGEVPEIGPFDATAGSGCEFKSEIYYDDQYRWYTSRFLLDANDIQTIILIIR